MGLPFPRAGGFLKGESIMAAQASYYNTASEVVQGSVTVTALAFFGKMMVKMVPYLIACIPLIVLDLVWGIKAARYRKERVRFSTAFRRTFGKAAEYLCWTILASTLSLAFETEWVEWIVLGAVYLNELSSIVGNYLETKGLEIVWKDVFRAVFRLGGQKAGVDTTGIDPVGFVRPVKQGRDKKGRYTKKGCKDETRRR